MGRHEAAAALAASWQPFLCSNWATINPIQIMEGHRFCGVEDEPRGEFVPIVPFQLQKLSDAMYLDDKEEGMAVFREVFDFLKMPREDPDNPEKVSSTTINESGSVIQDAVRGGKIDFLRLLLENGVDPSV